jgi:hypothetical protein
MSFLIQQILTECNWVLGLNSHEASQDPVSSYSMEMLASSEVRKGIAEKVPVVLGLKRSEN